MKDIPDFVLRQGASPVDWIEQHDRRPAKDQSFSYQERNEQDWWEQNMRIRALFGGVERQIKALLKEGKIPPVRLVSWSQLANRISCDRATLKHAERHYWVNAERIRLLTLIEEAKRKAEASAKPTAPEISEIEQLRRSLRDQRTETAIWYDKYITLGQEMSHMARVLARREEKIKELQSGATNGNQHISNC